MKIRWKTGNLFSNIGRGRHKIRRNPLWNKIYYLNGFNHNSGRWTKKRKHQW